MRDKMAEATRNAIRGFGQACRHQWLFSGTAMAPMAQGPRRHRRARGGRSASHDNKEAIAGTCSAPMPDDPNIAPSPTRKGVLCGRPRRVTTPRRSRRC